MRKFLITFDPHGGYTLDRFSYETQGLYLVGESTEVKEEIQHFRSFSFMSNCRDSFLQRVYSLFAEGRKEIECILLFDKLEKEYEDCLPRLINGNHFAYYYNKPDVKMEFIETTAEKKQIVRGVHFVFPREYYLGPMVFWIITRDFRKSLCGFSKDDEGWYQSEYYRAMLDNLRIVTAPTEIVKGLEITNRSSPQDFYKEVLNNVRFICNFNFAFYLNRQYLKEEIRILENICLPNLKTFMAMHSNWCGARLIGHLSLKEIENLVKELIKEGKKCN